MGKECCRWETLDLIRLHIVSEGQTEEGLVNSILAPALGAHNVFADTHRVTTGRRHGRISRGGLTNYEHLARDLMLWMKQDQNDDLWFTTIVDFYHLPNNFPGYEKAREAQSAFDQVAHLEAECGRDIEKRLDGLPVSQRFIPYIQLHEFEALLFSDAAKFIEAFPNNAKAIEQLTDIRAKFPSPEHIDHDDAPSKRILNLLPDYQKPVAGVLVAQRIGLEKICSECRRFDEWLAKLIEAAR